MKFKGLNIDSLSCNKHPVFRIVLFFPLLVIGSIPFLMLPLFLLNLVGGLPHFDDFSLKTLIGALIIFAGLSITFVASAHYWCILTGQKDLQSIGLDYRISNLMRGLIWGLAIQCLIFCLDLIAGWLRITSLKLTNEAMLNFILISLSSINAGIVEEILFRGVIYSSLRHRYRWVLSAIITSFIFMAFHFFQVPSGNILLTAMGLFAGGMLFAIVKEISGTLLIPIGIHIGWDAAIGLLNVSGKATPHFLVTTKNAPDWIIGGWGLSDFIALFLFAASIYFFKPLLIKSPS